MAKAWNEVLGRIKGFGTGGGPNRRPVRKLFSVLLLAVGGLLLLIAGGAYAWMYAEQRKLESQWQVQQSQQLLAAKDAENNRDVTLLLIPKIELQAAILDGVDRKSLLLAPGHVKKTPWPGEPGNSVVAGHRDTFFRHLNELNEGDDVYVRRGRREYHYVVSKTSILAPDRVEVMHPTSDTRLTLVTCYPTYYIGPAPKRLVVVARLRPDAAVKASQARSSPALTGQ